MFFLDFYRSVRRAVFLWGSCAALSASRKCRRHFYLGVWREGGRVYGRDPHPVHNGLDGLLGPRSHLTAASLRDSSTRATRLKTVTWSKTRFAQTNSTIVTCLASAAWESLALGRRMLPRHSPLRPLFPVCSSRDGKAGGGGRKKSCATVTENYVKS